MARLFHAGAEINASVGTVAQNRSPDGELSGTGTLTRDTVVFRSGLASWKYDSTGSNLGISSRFNATFVDGVTYYLRGYFRAAAAAGTACPILGFGTSGDIEARFNTDGTISLLVASVVQGSASVATITDSNWHRIELKAVAVATGNYNAAELLLDGSSVATWSGTQARSGFVRWGWLSIPGASEVLNVDDVALNDSTGAANTSYPGDGAVVLLKPTADSAKGTGWTNDAAGTSNFFDALDNTPPVGIADTTASTGLHQIRNATSNANSSYDATMTTYTAAGIGASDTVNAVLPLTATASISATSAKQGTVGVVSNPAITNIALDATGTSGAFWSGALAGTFGAGWKWSLGTMTNAPSVTLGTAPVMRITQVTSSTRIAMVCFMGIYVDYTPAAPAAAATLFSQPCHLTGLGML